jgi:hypothetical protein
MQIGGYARSQLMRMRNLLCNNSRDLTSLKSNPKLRLKSLEFSLGSINLAGFRPTQQKYAQVRLRCAVYSQL